MFAVFVASMLVVKLTNLSKRWEDAVIYTVVLFTVLVVTLRPAWGRPAFWKSLLPIFALHIIGVAVVVQALPPEWKGIPGLLFLAAGAAEGLLILAIVWRRTIQSRPERSATKGER